MGSPWEGREERGSQRGLELRRRAPGSSGAAAAVRVTPSWATLARAYTRAHLERT